MKSPQLLSLCLTLALSGTCLADHHEENQPLSEQLKARAAVSAKKFPPEMRKAAGSAIDEVEQSGILKRAKQVGDEAPDGTLMAWDETEHTLSDLWKEGPVVLTWYRGGWCPYCNLQMRAMQKSLEEIEGAGAKLVALSPELPENAKQTAESNKLSFLVLHDKESSLAHEYGIVFDLPQSIVPMYRDRLKLTERNGYDQLELPLAATYIVDTDGVIRWAFLEADYKLRAEPEDIINAVKMLKQSE